jgi:hypothetical protein
MYELYAEQTIEGGRGGLGIVEYDFAGEGCLGSCFVWGVYWMAVAGRGRWGVIG